MRNKLIKKYTELPVQLRASLWYLFCSFLQKGISFFTTPIFTRLLTTDEYGQIGVYNSWFGIIAVFLTLRIYYGVYSQGLIKYSDKRDVFSSSLMGLTSVLCLLGLIVYTLFRNFWNGIFKLSTPLMLAMIASIWAEAVYSFWAARKRVEYDYRKLVSLTIVVSLLQPILGILAVIYSRDKVTARIWEIVIVELCAYSGLFYIQIKRGRRFFDKKIWLYALGFNIPLIPHYLSQTILNSSDRIMIEHFVSLSAAGIYTLAYSLSQIMSLFNTALNQTIGPWIYEKIKLERTNDIGFVAYPSIIFVGVINIALIAFSPEIVSFFAPPDYYDAIWVIPPVAMSVFFNHIYNLCVTVEFYFEKSGFIAISTLLSAVLNLILNYLFIPKYGYIAAGYTTLISYILYAAAHYYLVGKICKATINSNHILKHTTVIKYSLLFICLGILFTFTYDKPMFRIVLICMITIILIINRKMIWLNLKNLFSKNKSL